jgi:predicted DNA-binding protein YlxM (UPF0122 family)
MLTPAEIYYIEAHFHHDTPISHIAKRIGRARQTVHNVIAYLRDGHTALDYYQAIRKKSGVVENGWSADRPAGVY